MSLFSFSCRSRKDTALYSEYRVKLHVGCGAHPRTTQTRALGGVQRRPPQHQALRVPRGVLYAGASVPHGARQRGAGRLGGGPLPTIRPHRHLQPALSRWVQQPREGCEDSSSGATAGSQKSEASKP